MNGADARVDAWADALRGEASDREGTAGGSDVLVERRREGADPVVEVRVRDAAVGASSIDLSPAEARRLAGELTAAASGAPPENGDGR